MHQAIYEWKGKVTGKALRGRVVLDSSHGISQRREEKKCDVMRVRCGETEEACKNVQKEKKRVGWG